MKAKLIILSKGCGLVSATESIIDLFHDDYRRCRRRAAAAVPLRVLPPIVRKRHATAALASQRCSPPRSASAAVAAAVAPRDITCSFSSRFGLCLSDNSGGGGDAPKGSGMREGGREGMRGGRGMLSAVGCCTDYIPPVAAVVHRRGGGTAVGLALRRKRERGETKRDFSH